MPTSLAQTRRHGHSRLSWLAAGARSAESLRRRMAKSGRTLAGQKLWTKAEIKCLRRSYPDYRKVCRALPCQSLSAIQSKAFRLRITRSRRVWSEGELKCMKVLYRQGRPMHEILTLLPGKTKGQIRRRARYSGWRRPRTPPKSYDIKPYDDVRDQAFTSKLTMRDLAGLSATGSYFLRAPSQTDWRKISKAVALLEGQLSVIWKC